MEQSVLGLYFEDFEVGAEIKHSLSKTIFESDNNFFSLLTMNHHPVHTNIDYAAKKLKLPIEKFYTNLSKLGNTSSASVPMALAQLYNENKLKSGDLIVLVGFGGGLTCGATLIKW